MAYDGNGTFQRIMNWVQDAASGIKIKADRHDQQDDDFAAGLSNAITKDGQTQPTANIPLNGHKLVNLADPTVDTDAATKKYVDAVKTFASGLEISGADALGRLKFISPTGVNGLSFTGADLAWLAKLADAAATPPTKNRLVLNDKPDGSGSDVVTVSDDGTIVSKSTMTASPSYIVKAASGNVHFWLKGPNDEDRAVLYTQADAEGPTTLRLKGSVNFNFLINGQFKAPGAVYAGNSFINTNGNIEGGGVWANWGHNDAYNAISARIENRAMAWANDRVANLAYRKVSQQYSTAPTFICPAGAVLTGYVREGGTEGEVYGVYFAYLQAYDPVRGWVGFSG